MTETTQRTRLRAFYARSWRRFEAGVALEPLEALVAEVVAEHPEYREFIVNDDKRVDDFPVESGQVNPFLHMGMHVALREQAAADRPAGFAAASARLTALSDDRHQAEHKMMECLGQTMWQAQSRGTPPDEQAFLECVRRLAPLGAGRGR